MTTDDTLVLCYHAVSPTWPSPLAVRPEALRTQVASLLAAGYRARTFSDAILDPEPGLTLAVTFDDAYRSTFELAAPILGELGVPATLFVPTDFPDSGVPFPLPGAAWVGSEFEGELSIMGWEEVRELDRRGWEIGAHTCSHQWLTQVDDERLRVELTASAAVLGERLGARPRSVAYPFGDHDDRVVAAAAAAGYEAACTVPHRFEHFGDSPLRFGRIDVTRDESSAAFRVRTARLSRRSRTTRANDVLRGLERHRPRRSTVLAAIDRGRRRRQVAAVLRRLTPDWPRLTARVLGSRPIDRLELRDGIDLRFPTPVTLDLDRLAAIFVERRFPVAPGDCVVDVGAGEGLLALYALERDAAQVLCVEADPGRREALAANVERNALDRITVADATSLDGIAAAVRSAGAPQIDLLHLGGEGGGALLLAATEESLEPVQRVLVHFAADAPGPRADEIVHRLERAGFEVFLDLDPKTDAGYIGARRLTAPS